MEDFTKELAPREKEIFLKRLMSEDPITLQEIGKRYGISRERARQIEAKIILKLKTFIKEKGKIDL